MTRLWGDSFDMYTTGTDLALRYTSFAGAAFGGPSGSAFNLGQYVTSFQASKTWETLAHETTVFFSFRMKYNSPVTPPTTNNMTLTIGETTNPQVTIAWDASTGSIVVYAGTVLGTVLATYTTQFQINLWDSWQGKIVIDQTAGSIEIRKNGNATPVISLTSANTRGPTSLVAYSTYMAMNAANTAWIIDDLWFNNNDGTAPTGWPPDVRAVMQQPAANTAQTDFLPSQATITYGQPISTFTGSWPANQMIGTTFTTAAGGTVTAFTVNLNAAYVGHLVGGIYDNTGVGGGPGTLLMAATAITNPTSGLNTLTLTSTLTLAKNTTYFMCLLSDTPYVTKSSNGGSQMVQTVTYASGLPTTAVTGNASPLNAPNLAIVLNVQKWTLINNLQETGDAFYISSNTVNAEDLYTLTPLPVTPTTILGVVPIVYWRKSDAGARSGSLRMVANGSADTDEGTVNLSSTYNYTWKFLPLDPTGAAWTQTNINGATIGVKVAA
jgi:hypothetical protein